MSEDGNRQNAPENGENPLQQEPNGGSFTFRDPEEPPKAEPPKAEPPKTEQEAYHSVYDTRSDYSPKPPRDAPAGGGPGGTAQGNGWVGGQTPPPNKSHTYGWSYDEYEKAKKASTKKNRGMMVFAIAVLCVFSLGVLVLAGIGVYSFVEARPDTLPPVSSNQPVEKPEAKPIDPNKPAVQVNPSGDAQGEAAPGELTRKEIAAKVKPSVVGILSAVTTQQGTGKSYGSGIVMTEDGYVITNAHVIEGATSITVILSDDAKQYPAKVIGRDVTTDLAVLKIEANGLVAAEFGDSDKLAVGDVAVAVGNPYHMELAGTTTFGYISAVNRTMTLEDGKTMTLIQTDASINPGNSGGPLVNGFGQVVGINTIKIGAGYEGLGFAIPMSVAKPIVDNLIQFGYVSGRPMIGISGADVTASMATYYQWPQGVYVQYVNESSDAYLKGIQMGDIVTAVDGVEIKTMNELNAEKNKKKAGDTLTLSLFRGGKNYEVSILLYEEGPAN